MEIGYVESESGSCSAGPDKDHEVISTLCMSQASSVLRGVGLVESRIGVWRHS